MSKQPENTEASYWVIVASKDHVQRAVKDQVIQSNHGKEAPLKRMKQGDGILLYSSKYFMNEPALLQAFTAIGQVKDDHIYQAHLSDNFNPFRRKVDYDKSIDVLIKPLLEELDFIVNKKNWGYMFRTGFFQITEKDFHLIAKKMLNYV